jgi:hypothetical protein
MNGEHGGHRQTLLSGAGPLQDQSADNIMSGAGPLQDQSAGNIMFDNAALLLLSAHLVCHTPEVG